MGIARPPDPYGMTAPPAWPDVDEDILRGCRDAFDTVLKTVTTQWEAAKRERPQMFEGAGIWSGGAADAAHNALRERIADLESVKDKLQASVDLFDNCVKEIVDAKNQIIDIVDIAHNLIDNIQNDPKIEDKAAAIQAIVNAARDSQHRDCRRSRGRDFGQAAEYWRDTDPARKRTSVVRFRPDSTMRPLSQLPMPWPEGPGDQRSPAPVAPQGPAIEPVANAPVRSGPGAGKGPRRQLVRTSCRRAWSPMLRRPAIRALARSRQRAPSCLRQLPDRDRRQAWRWCLDASASPSLGCGPGAPSTGGVGMPSSPLSSPSTGSPSTPSVPSTANPAAAAAGQTPATEFQRAMSEATKAAAAQPPMPPPQPMGAPAAAQPPAPPPMPEAPAAPPATQAPAASGPTGPSGGGAGPAPVAPPASAGAPAAPPPMPLGPPPTPPPAAPSAPVGPVGPGVAPAAAASAAGAVGAPAPVPVSAARAEREAIAAAVDRGGVASPESGGTRSDAVGAPHRRGAKCR